MSTVFVPMAWKIVAAAMVNRIWNRDVPMTMLVGTREQVDQRRHHHEAATDAEHRAEKPDNRP